MYEENNAIVEETKDVETVESTETENAGSGIVGKLIKGLLVVGLGTGVALYATRDKRKARRKAKAIEELQKDGYKVYKPEELDEDIIEAEDFTEN